MKKLCWFIFILGLVISCSTGTNNSRTTNIQHDDTLHGVVLKNYLHSKNSQYIFHTPYGIIGVPLTEGPTIQLLDTTDAHIIYARINSGKGPRELLSPLAEGFNPTNNMFSVSDYGKKQINNYRVSDTGLALVNEVNVNNINTFCTRNISDTLIAVLSSSPDQSLLLINDRAEVIDKIPYRILDIKGLNYNRKHHPSEIDLSRKNKIIVAADYHLPSIMAFSYVNNKLELLWKKMIFEPDYTIKNNWHWVTDEDRGGFERLVVTDKYIYVTYYGVTTLEWEKGIQTKFNEITLLIFDLDGNLVRTVLLDHNVVTFTVSPDDRVLYGVIERPDRLIVKFEL
ncbi:MAG: TolB-like 6-bladed beta-propeller domain-containing protein [Lentimicrobium sp.]|jgi:hypothetical protein|nr:TolB-like 6-bladed beta-propeller domain-containing protein [Lentimicrobium sp.]